MSDYSSAMRHEWAGEESDYADERAEDEVTVSMCSVEQQLRNELEALRARMANARAFVISALSGVETGSALPLISLDSVLTKALQHLGCADCGQVFSVSDSHELACVRQHGVHAGHCS